MSTSVIVPTIGRESIRRTIESILDQGNLVAEIIIVDSGNGVKFTSSNPKIRIIKAQIPFSVSSARNTGIKSVNEMNTWVAFCDDDDIWLPNKLKTQIEFATNAKLDAVLSAGIFLTRKKAGIIRPSIVYTYNKKPLIFLYSFFNNRKKYFPFPSLIVKLSFASRVKFDESLNNREDLKFIQDLHTLGASIWQIPEPLVEIHSCKKRSLERSNFKDDFRWAKYLFKISPSISFNFIVKILIRNFLYLHIVSALERFLIPFWLKRLND